MNRVSKKLLVFAALLLLLGGEVIAQQKLVIGFSVSTQVNPFYVAMADGVKEEAARQGVEVYVLNANDKLDKQIADVEDLIQKKIQVLD